MTRMFDRLTPWAPHILGIFRILTGIMFACHGAQKVLGMFGGIPAGYAPPAWIQWGGGTIELVGGLLVALGLFTRPVAFLCSGTMAVAYFYGHGFTGKGWVPKVNGGELAVLYCWIFLYLSAAGPGAFALDNVLWKRKAVS